MLTKESVTKQIKDLPEVFTLDELIERLLVVEKVNQGLKEVESGKTLSEEELDKKMEKWFV